MSLPITETQTHSQQKSIIYLKSAILVAFFSELYFLPFDKSFRFSAGIILLDALIILYNRISAFKLSIFAGFATLFFRILIANFNAALPLEKTITFFVPSLIFYLVYGICHEFAKKYNQDHSGVLYFFLFISIEIIANLSELWLRNAFSFKSLQLAFWVSLLRTLCAFSLCLLIQQKNLYILNTEHQKNYVELNLLFSNLQSEFFYLKKSSRDIECLMQKSYTLYQELSDTPEYASEALSIARDVHEIKKDYLRVLSGLEVFQHQLAQNASIYLNDALTMIEENTHRYVAQNYPQLTFDFRWSCEKNIILTNPYALFSILNNLIVNSIESAQYRINIAVHITFSEANMLISVSDNGPGIPDDILPFIFNPGFTTKLDTSSDKPSSGMGLSHVKTIVDMLGGSIDLLSSKEPLTIFKLEIPKLSIERDVL